MELTTVTSVLTLWLYVHVETTMKRVKGLSTVLWAAGLAVVILDHYYRIIPISEDVYNWGRILVVILLVYLVVSAFWHRSRKADSKATNQDPTHS